jgi:hypothetical protein
MGYRLVLDGVSVCICALKYIRSRARAKSTKKLI